MIFVEAPVEEKAFVTAETGRFNSCIENREERDGKGRVYIAYMRRLVIQLHFLEYKLRAKQVPQDIT